jgi:hypothetical protein
VGQFGKEIELRGKLEGCACLPRGNEVLLPALLGPARSGWPGLALFGPTGARPDRPGAHKALIVTGWPRIPHRSRADPAVPGRWPIAWACNRASVCGGGGRGG